MRTVNHAQAVTDRALPNGLAHQAGNVHQLIALSGGEFQSLHDLAPRGDSRGLSSFAFRHHTMASAFPKRIPTSESKGGGIRCEIFLLSAYRSACWQVWPAGPWLKMNRGQSSKRRSRPMAARISWSS